MTAGMYLHGFLRTFLVRDGLIRYTILLYCLLLALPAISVIDCHILGNTLRPLLLPPEAAAVPGGIMVRAHLAHHQPCYAA
jgi:hypothetical protein